MKSSNPKCYISKTSVFLMNMNVSLGSLNLGYVLSYLTLSIDTLFANLGISVEEKTNKLSLINGILPLGCVVGVFIGYFLKKKLSYKQCIHIADIIGLLSLLATIADLNVIIAFRFFLGISNGLSSLIMPVYVKSLCPQQLYAEVSMCIGYGLNLGLAAGQLMGIGYIYYNGASSNWWRIVFLFPSIICIIRSCILHFVYDYDAPELLIMKGQIEQAKYVLRQIYREEFVEQEFERCTRLANKEQLRREIPFFHIFKKKQFVTLQVGLFSMIVQIWCGSIAVFYYSAQIFDQLADGNVSTITIYTICIGIFGLVAQIGTTIMVPRLGSKNVLIVGSFIMTIINIIIGILSEVNTPETSFTIFILLVLLIMVFSATLGPVAWSIVPQINDDDATFFVMEQRWACQVILTFTFPYIVKSMYIIGSFLMFAGIDFLFLIYTCFFVVDGRGKTHDELLECYHVKYGIISQKIQQSEDEEQDKLPELQIQTVKEIPFDKQN